MYLHTYNTWYNYLCTYVFGFLARIFKDSLNELIMS